jgi:hypothetical protein
MPEDESRMPVPLSLIVIVALSCMLWALIAIAVGAL